MQKMRIEIAKRVSIPASEIEITAVRSRGAGGQHVNKVSTAIQLRFDIMSSSLPSIYKKRLMNLSDRRITKGGMIIIKVQQERSQWQNREIALNRLKDLIKKTLISPKKRIPTKATKSSQLKRLESKSRKGHIKALRGKIKNDDDE